MAIDDPDRNAVGGGSLLEARRARRSIRPFILVVAIPIVAVTQSDRIDGLGWALMGLIFLASLYAVARTFR